ncbi:MAG: GDSL-type esterase/lipase family protein, partial [Candidatus Levyibacteriota bacterium]
AMGGVDSGDILAYQVPPAIAKFEPDVVTVSAGLHDMEKILLGADPNVVFPQLAQNMHDILCDFTQAGATVIVGNFPDFPWLTAVNPQVRAGIIVANQIIATEASSCGAKVADVFTAFDGRKGLFLYGRPGVPPSETHPTNLGYRVMEQAYIDAARQ